MWTQGDLQVPFGASTRADQVGGVRAGVVGPPEVTTVSLPGRGGAGKWAGSGSGEEESTPSDRIVRGAVAETEVRRATTPRWYEDGSGPLTGLGP